MLDVRLNVLVTRVPPADGITAQRIYDFTVLLPIHCNKEASSVLPDVHRHTKGPRAVETIPVHTRAGLALVDICEREQKGGQILPGIGL